MLSRDISAANLCEYNDVDCAHLYASIISFFFYLCKGKEMNYERKRDY